MDYETMRMKDTDGLLLRKAKFMKQLGSYIDKDKLKE